jgi:hypothetical protein
VETPLVPAASCTNSVLFYALYLVLPFPTDIPMGKEEDGYICTSRAVWRNEQRATERLIHASISRTLLRGTYVETVVLTEFACFFLWLEF